MPDDVGGALWPLSGRRPRTAKSPPRRLRSFKVYKERAKIARFSKLQHSLKALPCYFLYTLNIALQASLKRDEILAKKRSNRQCNIVTVRFFVDFRTQPQMRRKLTHRISLRIYLSCSHASRAACKVFFRRNGESPQGSPETRTPEESPSRHSYEADEVDSEN